MSLHMPPRQRRQASVWPVIGLGLGVIVLGGAFAFGIAMWTTRDQRSSMAELTAQMRQPGVTRAAVADAMILPPPPVAVDHDVMPVAADAVHRVSVQAMIDLLAEQLVSGPPDVSVVRAADLRPVLRLDAPAAEATLETLTARLPAAVQEGEIDLPPGFAMADGSFDTQSLAYHLLQVRLRSGDAGARELAEVLRRQAIASLGPGAIVTPDGHVLALSEGDTLAGIALIFYGDLTAQHRIVAANPDTLAGDAAIVAGQRLRLPGT